MNDAVIQCKQVAKSYRIGRKSIEVLHCIDWEIERGRWTALLGASGSGKTTLLNLLGTLERPDAGTIFADGVEYGSLSARSASEFRCRKIGFVFQSYHLLPELSVLENVLLPARFRGRDERKYAAELLARVGLSDRAGHRPGELSGGEQQRAAIARALINRPAILLADEPTGNLDAATGEEILRLFGELRQESCSIMMITHSERVAGAADRTVRLENGVILC